MQGGVESIGVHQFVAVEICVHTCGFSREISQIFGTARYLTFRAVQYRICHTVTCDTVTKSSRLFVLVLPTKSRISSHMLIL